MEKAHFKSALIGGVVATVITTATAAFAGTGVGGIFNLGQTNTVDAPSTLSGTTNDAQLKVTNTNTGASAGGLRIQTASGKPPVTVVGTTARAPNFNADLLDGMSAAQLGRVAYAEDRSTTWFTDGRTSLQTVTLTAPQRGFVTLSGGASAAYFSGCAYCATHLRFRIDGTTDSGTTGTVITKTGVEQYADLTKVVTIPVAKGAHTYELIGSWYDVNATSIAPTSWFDPSLNAQFIPFNANGGQDPLAAAKPTRQGGASGSILQGSD